jgi:glycosyltransferase involved in cell wall biosynthesis
MPLVVAEAMSCGIPIVSFRCKYGPEETLTNNLDGLLVEDGNIHELSEKILWMIQHPQERLAMGAAARETAKKFRKEVVVEKWLDTFKSLLK